MLLKLSKYPLCLGDQDIKRSAAEFITVISDLLVLLCPLPVVINSGTFLCVC